MRGLLVSEPSTDEGTFGKLTLGDLTWNTLELRWEDNHPQYSCIPAGVYHCRLEATSKWSPREDGLLYHVLDVPGRSLIKIHAATWAGDVRAHWHSDLLGCIAPGKERGMLRPPEVPAPQHCILQSRIALGELMQYLDGAEWDLEIQRA